MLTNNLETATALQEFDANFEFLKKCQSRITARRPETQNPDGFIVEGVRVDAAKIDNIILSMLNTLFEEKERLDQEVSSPPKASPAE
jgi:hypothetical protein